MSPMGMSWPRKISGLQLQTSLSACTDAKGFSGALTNPDARPPTNETPSKCAAGRAFLNATYQLNARRMARVALSRKPRRRAICTM